MQMLMNAIIYIIQDREKPHRNIFIPNTCQSRLGIEKKIERIDLSARSEFTATARLRSVSPFLIARVFRISVTPTLENTPAHKGIE